MKLVIGLAVLAAGGVAAYAWLPESTPPLQAATAPEGAAPAAAPAPVAPVAPAATLAAAAAPAAPAAEKDDDDGADDGTEEIVALDSVPDAALAAAKKAVPGITFTVAEKEVEGGRTVYCLEGSADGKRWEVEVTPEGEVVEIESGDGD